MGTASPNMLPVPVLLPTRTYYPAVVQRLLGQHRSVFSNDELKHTFIQLTAIQSKLKHLYKLQVDQHCAASSDFENYWTVRSQLVYDMHQIDIVLETFLESFGFKPELSRIPFTNFQFNEAETKTITAIRDWSANITKRDVPSKNWEDFLIQSLNSIHEHEFHFGTTNTPQIHQADAVKVVLQTFSKYREEVRHFNGIMSVIHSKDLSDPIFDPDVRCHRSYERQELLSIVQQLERVLEAYSVICGINSKLGRLQCTSCNHEFPRLPPTYVDLTSTSGLPEKRKKQ